MEQTVKQWYVVAYHGTAGLDSYGHVEIVHGNQARPAPSATVTVDGPMMREHALQVERSINERFEAYRASAE